MNGRWVTPSLLSLKWVGGVGGLTAGLLTPESQTSGRAALGPSMWRGVGLARRGLVSCAWSHLDRMRLCRLSSHREEVR